MHPEYIQPLREEIEAIIEKEGWTKASVMKMRKLDSFLKESIRMHPLGQSVSSILNSNKSLLREKSAEVVYLPRWNYNS